MPLPNQIRQKLRAALKEAETRTLHPERFNPVTGFPVGLIQAAVQPGQTGAPMTPEQYVAAGLMILEELALYRRDLIKQLKSSVEHWKAEGKLTVDVDDREVTCVDELFNKV